MEKVGETQQIIEENAVNAPVKDVLWNANEIETEAVKVEDPGEGVAVILRHYFFKKLPTVKGFREPTKAQLFAHYKKLIEANLWGDGLVPREDKKIEIHSRHKVKGISKALFVEMVKNNADFVIMLLAEPRKGVLLDHTPTIAV